MIHRFFLIHGAGGSPEENWFPWLTQELEYSGAEVIAPQFPGGESENYDAWRRELMKYEAKLDENTVMIGHSIGVPFILRVIEEKEVAGCILVSGMNVVLENPYKEIISRFVHHFDWRAIRAHCARSTVIHSDNDPFVPLKCAEDIATELETDPIIIPDGGHFNTASGYTKFPALLEEALPYLME